MVVQTQMMLNAQVAQIFPGKHQKHHKFVLADSKLCEIAEVLKISEGSVFTILHEHLSMRKLCSKWVLCLLTVDQKEQRIDDSEYCLQLFQCSKKEFLRKYVTMDEILIHHFMSQSNWQSAEWTAAGESRLKWPKTQTSAGKVLTSVFWDVQSILFINYLVNAPGKEIWLQWRSDIGKWGIFWGQRNSDFPIVLKICNSTLHSSKLQHY